MTAATPLARARGAWRSWGGGKDDFVPYNLYKDAARQSLWDSKNPYTGTGSGTAEDMVVYGRIPTMAKTPASGKYTDIVMLTVSW
ncbi:spore coat protein U domain-containing protein [Achromobacter ruhlandii]|uniref:spore coat protein U domain-containing protein n=1 Tax=Achromobacter ruhlandii TaxID=72557 RepID=UPI003A0FD5B7